LIAVKAKDAAVPAAWPARCRRSHDQRTRDLSVGAPASCRQL